MYTPARVPPNTVPGTKQLLALIRKAGLQSTRGSVSGAGYGRHPTINDTANLARAMGWENEKITETTTKSRSRCKSGKHHSVTRSRVRAWASEPPEISTGEDKEKKISEGRQINEQIFVFDTCAIMRMYIKVPTQWNDDVSGKI